MGAINATTDASFEQDVLKSSTPVLVDFWAVWCGPCRAVAPILEEIANEYPALTIVKLDTEANPRTAAKYGITGIPTLNVYQNGEVVKTIVGAQPKPRLIKELEPWLQG